MYPIVDELRGAFGESIGAAHESCGDVFIFIARDRSVEILRWLKDRGFNYLVDITAVEYRDPELPLEVVYELFDLEQRRPLRVKVALPKDQALEIDSVFELWKGANWLEREVFDMFGVRFAGHPDLRRILMWETYAEGFPLRKDFPLRGRFSRSEQVRQALMANPEAHYSMEELSIAEQNIDLPAEMKERLAHGERGVIPEPGEAKNG